MKKALPVLFAALLVCAVPLSALSHEGPHQKGEGHEMGSSQRGFEEGSGSSVLEESGHEARKRSGHKTMGSDHKMEEGSGGMKQPAGGHNDSEYEEKSGQRPQEMKTKTHRMREGS